MSENEIGKFWQKTGEFGQETFLLLKKKHALWPPFVRIGQRGHFRPHWPFHRGVPSSRLPFGRSSYGFGKLDGCFSFGHFEIKDASGQSWEANLSKFSSSFDSNFEKWRSCSFMERFRTLSVTVNSRLCHSIHRASEMLGFSWKDSIKKTKCFSMDWHLFIAGTAEWFKFDRWISLGFHQS